MNLHDWKDIDLLMARVWTMLKEKFISALPTNELIEKINCELELVVEDWWVNDLCLLTLYPDVNLKAGVNEDRELHIQPGNAATEKLLRAYYEERKRC